MALTKNMDLDERRKLNGDGTSVCTLSTNTIYNTSYDVQQTVNRMNWFHLAQDRTSSGWSSMQ